jgi:CheY-like chemotaxis protein
MIETSKERDNVVLRVADTGIGIPEENIQRLFTPFFTTSVESGKGLGLATCRTIIEGHGGHIFAENNEDGGALFTLELPFALMTDAHGTKQAEPGAVAPLSILVVDDKVDVLNMLKSGLEMYGHSVRIAPSAGEALEIFDKEPVDAVLCDLSIPDLNGWEVGKIMKNRREGAGRQKIPFILLTGWMTSDEQDPKIPASGVDAIMEKPAAPGQLVKKIQELVSSRPRIHGSS